MISPPSMYLTSMMHAITTILFSLMTYAFQSIFLTNHLTLILFITFFFSIFVSTGSIILSDYSSDSNLINILSYFSSVFNSLLYVWILLSQINCFTLQYYTIARRFLPSFYHLDNLMIITTENPNLQSYYENVKNVSLRKQLFSTLKFRFRG